VSPDRLRRLRRTLASPDVRGVVRRYYWLVAGLVPAAGVLAMGRPFVARHGIGPPLPHNDTVILEYVGWFVARGNTLYVDVWEIKPPAAFLPPYLVARLSGGDVYVLHLAGIVLTGLSLAVATAAAARIVGRATGAPLAGVSVGLVVLALPDLLYLPWLGYKAKALVFALGLPAVEYALRGRSLTSGVLAGLAVGVWQLGIVFPLVTTATVLTAEDRAGLRRHALGGAVAAVLVVGFLLSVGDVEGFLAAVLLAPLTLRTDAAGFDPATYARFFPSPAGILLTLVGAAGLALAAVDGGRLDPSRLLGPGLGFDHDLDLALDGPSPASVAGDGVEPPVRPLALGGAFVAGQLLLDFDGLWDVLAPLLFVAVGVGLLVGRLSRPARILAALAILAAVLPTFAPSEFVRHDPIELESSDGLPPALDAEREHVYWTRQPIRSCRFFGGGTQRSLLPFSPGADRLADAPCGRVDPYLRAADGRLPAPLPPPIAGEAGGAGRGVRADAAVGHATRRGADPAPAPTRAPGPGTVESGVEGRSANGSTRATPGRSRTPPRSPDGAIEAGVDPSTHR
jgi:hypothetical protein